MNKEKIKQLNQEIVCPHSQARIVKKLRRANEEKDHPCHILKLEDMSLERDKRWTSIVL